MTTLTFTSCTKDADCLAAPVASWSLMSTTAGSCCMKVDPGKPNATVAAALNSLGLPSTVGMVC